MRFQAVINTEVDVEAVTVEEGEALVYEHFLSMDMGDGAAIEEIDQEVEVWPAT